MTGQEVVLDQQADSVVLPARDGLVGILAHHAPLSLAIGKGKLAIRSSGQSRHYAVSGGLANMADNKLDILVETCLPA
jgi:F-type H+-transporting ATPase subunit epsilon